jgi:hypothetical protein
MTPEGVEHSSKPRLLALTAALLATGCGLIGFDVEQPIPEQRVPGSPLGGLLPVSVFAFPLSIDIQQQTKAMNTGPATGAYLKVISLKVVTPPSETFGFLDSLSVVISADGLPETEVAKLAPVPKTAAISLNLVPRVNLLPYLQKAATMKASASGRAPSTDVTFNGRVVVNVEI